MKLKKNKFKQPIMKILVVTLLVLSLFSSAKAVYTACEDGTCAIYECSLSYCSSGGYCYYNPTGGCDGDYCVWNSLDEILQCNGDYYYSSCTSSGAYYIDCGNKDCDYLDDCVFGVYKDYDDCNKPCSGGSCTDCTCTYSSSCTAGCNNGCYTDGDCSTDTYIACADTCDGARTALNRKWRDYYCDSGCECTSSDGDCETYDYDCSDDECPGWECASGSVGCSDSCGTNTLNVSRTKPCTSSCVYGSCNSGTTYTCNSGSHTNCQSYSCGGTTYNCTNDGSTWEWRTSSPAESIAAGNCNDGIDNDCDGAADDEDYDCDITAPTTTLTITQGAELEDWYIDDVKFTLSCEDTGAAGCDTIYYRYYVTGETPGAFQEYSSEVTITNNEQNNTIQYYSNDTLNNLESTKTSYIAIRTITVDEYRFVLVGTPDLVFDSITINEAYVHNRGTIRADVVNLGGATATISNATLNGLSIQHAPSEANPSTIKPGEVGIFVFVTKKFDCSDYEQTNDFVINISYSQAGQTINLTSEQTISVGNPFKIENIELNITDEEILNVDMGSEGGFYFTLLNDGLEPLDYKFDIAVEDGLYTVLRKSGINYYLTDIEDYNFNLIGKRRVTWMTRLVPMEAGDYSVSMNITDSLGCDALKNEFDFEVNSLSNIRNVINVRINPDIGFFSVLIIGLLGVGFLTRFKN